MLAIIFGVVGYVGRSMIEPITVVGQPPVAAVDPCVEGLVCEPINLTTKVVSKTPITHFYRPKQLLTLGVKCSDRKLHLAHYSEKEGPWPKTLKCEDLLRVSIPN